MRICPLIAIVCVGLMLPAGRPGPLAATAPPAAGSPASFAADVHPASDPEPHPAIPRQASWARSVILAVLALFLAALLIGMMSSPAAPAEAGPEELHPSHHASPAAEHDRSEP